MKIVLDESYMAKSSVVALGMFDGVHIGHRVLLQRGAALARQRGVPLVVCTFAEHPLRVIAPEKTPPMLCSFEERNRLMEAQGVDVLYAMPFNRELMQMPPEDFVGHLVRRFHPTDVVCGYNYTFGREGKGGPALLSALGAALGFAASIVPRITLEGEDVSSTAIRGLLANGDVDIAARMLGRSYELRAEVLSHEKGVCVLRLADEGKQLLPDGCYRALCGDGTHHYPVLAHLRGSRIRFALPQHCPVEGQVSLLWLSNDAIDF